MQPRTNFYFFSRIDFAHASGKIIVVVKGPVPPKQDLPPNIYKYIQKNTYLSSSDANFFKKLSESLDRGVSGSKIEPPVRSISKPSISYDEWKRVKDGDPSKINANLFMNEQAKHLSYNGKYEIDRSKFETGIMLGGGNFGCVCEGIAEGLFHPGQQMKVAVKTVNNILDATQLHALMCEI